MAYAKLRGPVGPHRFDTLAAMISMHGSRPYQAAGSEVSLADFMPPWIPPPEDDEDD